MPNDQQIPATTPLSAMDTAWLRMDEPANLMQIMGVLVFGAELPLETARALVAERLATIPRFRQVVTWRGRTPHWQPDPDFAIERHVFACELPAPGGETGLAALAGDLLGQPLPRDRPLWEMRLIADHQGGSALVVRLHHAIGDGVALMMVLLSLTELDAGGAGVNPLLRLFHDPGQSPEEACRRGEAVMPDTMRLMRTPIESWARVPALLRAAGAAGALVRLVCRWPDPRTAFKGPLGVPKRVAWSRSIPVADVRAVGQALGGTINDVLVSAMTGALHRYLAARSAPPPALNVRAAMPVSLRPLEELASLGNRFGLIFLALPVGIADPLQRLAEVRRRADRLKRSAEPWVVLAILRAMGWASLWIQRLVVTIFATKATTVLTNVPGPRHPLYLGHAPIQDFFFWVPQSGRVGIGLSILSYAGNVRVGIGTDAGLVPDPDTIARAFEQEFEELQRLGGG
jgi:diacylglycerol O-acyltransferase / wax synthase